MRARIAGLEQALANTGDAKSVLNIAEQNLYKIQDLLEEIKTKVIQGANATGASDEREFVRQQINGYSSEINSIINGSIYNGMNLLDGSYDAVFQVGESINDTMTVLLDQNISVQDLQIYEVSTRGQLTTDGTATSGSSINAFHQWQAIQAGDTFDIILTQGDGNQLAPITITAAGQKGQLTTTTIGDIVAAINATGVFDAEFNAATQSIDIRETVPIEGNGLSVQIANFQEFPGVDGAFANFSFSFDNTTGALRTNFSSSGGFGAGTPLNNLDQFSDLEGQDEIRITLNPRSGASEEIVVVLPGPQATPSNFTIGDLRDAINAQSVKFSASVDGSGQIVLTEVDLDQLNLNASAVFDDLDLDIGPASVDNVNFSQSATQAVVESVAAGTSVNGSFLGQDFREGDSFTIQLRRNDGSITNVNYTIQGGDTFEDIRQAIINGSSFDAQFSGGDLIVTEPDITAGTALRVRFQNFQQSNATFNNTDFIVDGDDLRFDDSGNGITGATRIADTGLGAGFASGDSFTINILNKDGTETESIIYTFTSADDTFNDLLSVIDAQVDPAVFDAQISGGALIITDLTVDPGTSLAADFGSFSQNNATFSNTNSTSGDEYILTSIGQLSPGFTPTTLLNDLNQFTNIQAGDTLDMTLVTADGSTRLINFTFAGDQAGPSTSTVGDLISAISAEPGISASFDASLGHIVIEDTANTGSQIQFSFSNSDFTESPRPTVAVVPSPPLSFTYQDEAMVTTGLGAGGTGTNINDLAGFNNIRGGDTLDIALSTRAGSNSTFTFTFAGDAGQNTTSTVGDLVNFIDGQNIGNVQFEASLSGGEIVIEESNPPAVGGLGTSTSFTENNIDITPKAFSTFQFSVTDFLRVSEDTGLVLGLGLIDFDSGSEFTQQVASVMINNINDSIDRVISVINDIGNIQTRLSIREETLQSSINSNAAQRSRMMDVDYAKEISRQIQLQILNEFQTVAIAQANMNPMSILALL